ncbi:MAG: ribonuclease HII [Porphyromonadaceae bacterium CG2_30_38_12]|nr:MAG: ribonuclease HII [Porphyromonadaceae bacterium CG2_30_38_12]
MPLLANFSGYSLECGTDEAGRGCLAGPVVAAAVILPANFVCLSLNDSKQLTEKERDALRPIIERESLAWAIGVVDNVEIDNMNILNASILAMHKAIDGLKLRPDYIIVDGNRFKPYDTIPFQTIVKGDAIYLSIAAASVIAKTHRDELMTALHAEFPYYGWDKNKGYPTKAHRLAISKYGTCEFHRLTFNLLGDKDFYMHKKFHQKLLKASRQADASSINNSQKSIFD